MKNTRLPFRALGRACLVLGSIAAIGCSGATAQSASTAPAAPAAPASADDLNWDDMPATKALAVRPQGLPAPSQVVAPPSDCETTDSGLATKVLRAGTGASHPSRTSQVKVHYIGWTTDGKMFDSSFKRGAPNVFPLDKLIAGWTEGIQLMVEGERRRFWIPETLAYRGRPGRPKGMLVFDVELIAIDP